MNPSRERARHATKAPAWAAALLCLAVWAGAARAGDISYDVQPPVLRIGETATATITISGVANPPPPTFPQVDGLQIAATGQRASTQWVNGKHSSSISYTFRIVPTKEGRITLPPFNYSVGNQSVTLPAKTLEVVAQGQGRFATGQGETQLKDVLFVKLGTDRAEVYNQEFFDIYVSVYHRGIQLGPQITPSRFPEGMSVQQLQHLQGSREVIDGQIFEVERFRARAHAITAGTFTFQPTFGLQLVVQQRNRRNSFFDPFFGGQQLQPVQITPDPIQVTILPLPAEGRPPDFSGAVGNFAFNVQVTPAQVTAGDPVTITTSISGKGNIATISAPQIVLGDHFRVYDPKLTSQKLAQDETQGVKTFEQVIIPRSEQASELPSLRFSYFDPLEAKYKTQVRGPFPLEVSPAAEGGVRTVEAAPGPRNTQVRQLGRDIVYLKDAPQAWHIRGQQAWYASPGFLALQVIPVLLFGIVSLAARRRDNLAEDVAKARRLHAPKSARDGLRRARSALENSESRAFYEALWEALAAYFADRLNLAPGEVTQDVVVAAVTRGGLGPDDVQGLRDLFHTCEQERFGAAGNASGKEQRDLLDRLSHLLRRCEKIRV